MWRATRAVLMLIAMTVALHADAQSDWTDKSPHKSRFITVNGVRLHYLDWGGKGDTMLFLHGLGDTAHIYDDLAPKFTNQFRVLGLTRRGHGQSEKPEAGMTPLLWWRTFGNSWTRQRLSVWFWSATR